MLSPRLSPRTKLLFRIVVALVALGSLIAALAYGPARLLHRPAAWQQHPRNVNPPPRPTTARTNTTGRITPKTLQANGKIAFVSDRDGNFEIYVMNPDGTEQTRLTNNAAIDAAPSFSPDGSKIVFDSNRGGSVAVFVMKADGASQTALTSNATDDLDPSFSPDGSKIVFVSDRDGHDQIYLMNADGTNQTRLTNNASDDDDPMFSPDGSKIVFVSDRDGHDQIYLMNADGTNQTNLSNTPVDDDNPSFSPDGGKIVFDSNGDVFVMNADGTNRTNLTNNPGSDNAASFSPDGSKIVFDSNRDGHDQIYVMNADGMNQTNRSNNPAFDSFPAWQTLLNCTPPPPNMVAWYRAEDSANDEIGGHNGTLQNGATTNPGFVGQAFSFDGVDDDVEVADDPVFDSATQTIDFWLKTTQSGVNAGVIGKHDQSGSTNGYAIHLSANGYVILTFKQTDPFTSSSIISDVAVNDGRFHHVAAVFQSGGATAIYIDGRLAASGTIFSLTFNATPLRLGRTLDTFYAPYNGLLDEVDIFDRALTAAEIKNIYDAKSAGKCLASPSQTITVSNTNDSGPGSLRQAMLDANASPGIQTIIFNIAGAGVHTIQPTSPLPVINDAVIIDGSTQPGYAGTPLIELDGTNATMTNGINILAGGTTIRALAINRFQGHGINIDTANGNTIVSCFIGTNAAGTAALPNTAHGVALGNANDNTIGGTTATERNVISGNGSVGVFLIGTSTNNVVIGNYLGTDVNGTADLGNTLDGVNFQGASGNRVGGTTAGERNVISGNDRSGVFCVSGANNNLIEGNYIGTNAAGTAAISSTGTGVGMQDSGGNTIGGTTAGAGNVISGWGGAAVAIGGTSATSNNVVQGNLIGTNAAGTAAIANGTGVAINGIANSNTIGGTTPAARNVISGNTDGVTIMDSTTHDNLVQGNFIGTDVGGSSAIANGHGILIQDSQNNTIGGTSAGAGNTIASNTLTGVLVVGTAAGNKIRGNSITSNGALGIDLSDDGVTANDTGDGDTGPNNLQNFPVVTSAQTVGSNTQVAGTLNSEANAQFDIEFFSNPTCDASGNGEGQTFLGSTVVNTDSSGNATFNVMLATTTTAGQAVTATATKSNGDTSEFSACQTVTATPATTIFWLNAAGGNWNNTANWQDGTGMNRVPTTGDNVFITLAGTYTVTLDVSPSINSLTLGGSSGRQTLDENLHTLTLAGTSAVNANGIFTLSGALNGAGDFNVSGRLNWRGQMAGTGTTNVLAGATFVIDGGQPQLIRTLNNSTTAQYNVTSSFSFGNGTFNNLAGATFDVLADKQIFSAAGTNVFNNAGTFRKATATGTLDINVPFNNTGTVDLQAGTLNLNTNGTSSGAFNGAASTTLLLNSQTLQAASSVTAPTVNLSGTNSFAGTYNVSGTTTIGGSSTFTGNVQSVGTTLTVNGTATFNSNAITAATINLSGTINGSADVNPTATGTFNFNGTLQGTGTTSIAAGATLNLGGSQPFLGRTLNNAGTANYNMTSAMAFGNGTFNNQSGALFDLLVEKQLFQAGGTNAFNNAGTVRKLSGTGETLFGIPFSNTNTVTLQSGILNFSAGGTSTGNFTGAAGTEFKFGGANLQAASSVSAPTVSFTQGTNSVAGTFNVSGTTNVNSTTTFSGSNITSVGTALNVSATATFNSNNITAQTITLTGTINGSADVSPTATGTFNFNGILQGTGATNIAAGATLNLGGSQPQLQRTLNNSGTANFNVTSAMAFTGATFNNQAGATFNALVDRQIFTSGGTNLFSNSGTLRKTAGAGTTDFNLPVTNGGLLEVQTGTLRLHVSYTQVAGGDTFLNGGNIQSDGVMIIQGGTLRGAGTITGTVNNNSIVSPGNAGAGLLNITGQYIQQSGAALNIELGGTSAGTQYDQLQVGGAATLDGTLNITTINGFTPTNAQSFQVLTYGSRSGSFSSVTGGFTPTYNANDLVVSLTPVVTTADLAVTQTDAPDPVTDGNQLTYTINVTNNGPDTATGVTLTETLPNGGAQPTAVVRSFTTTQGSCTQGVGQVNCNLGSLNNGATATVTIQTSINGTGTANANASVAANENDPNSANNTQGASTTVQAGVCVAPPANLVAWYTGDDHPNDIQGGNHATLENGASFASGRVGSAFSFDGVDDDVNVPNASALNSTTATWDFWLKTTQTVGGNPAGIIAKHDQTGSTNGVTVTMNSNGQISVFIKDSNGAGGSSITASPVVNDGQFHHVALTFQSGGNLIIYVDGTQAATTPVVTFAFNATPLRMGRVSDNFWSPFNGLVDEVEIFNRVLNASEVQAIYTAGGAGKCKPTAFTVSGHVQDNLNNNLSGVTLALGGSQSATTTSDANGNYSFANLPAGGNYTVTPSLTNYGFVPASQTFNNLNAPQAANFTGTQQVFAIGGRITDSSNNAISGITVNLSGSANASTTTDASGNYSFANLAGGGNYTVTPTASNFEFNPTSAQFNNLSANQTADFTATPSVSTPIGNNVVVSVGNFTVTYTTVSASGRTRATPINPTSAGSPPANTTIVTNAPAADLNTTATFAGTITVCTNVTSVNDAATFSTLRLLHREGVSLVDRTSSVDFASRTVCGQVASLSPFVVGRLLPTGTQPIAGRILDNNNHALAGATLTLSDANNEATLVTTTTDATGSYSFNAPNGGDYRITPSKLNTVFTPSAHSFLNLSVPQTGNFSATTAISITGQLLDETSHGVAGVTMILSGTVTRQTQTLPGGHYLFTGLPPGGTYTVKPEDNARLYNPARTDVPPAQSTGNTNANFNGTTNPNPTPTPPIISDFAGPAPDPQVFSTGLLTQIPGSTDPLVITTQQNGKFVITPRANTTDVSFNGIVTVDAVDFTNTSASVEVDQTANNGAQTIFAIGADERNFFRFVAEDVEPNPSQANSKRDKDSPQDQTTLRQLIFQVRQAGVLQAVSGAGHVPLDPQQMRFWRFRHEAATHTMFFETSPTGIDGTWTPRGSFVLPGAVGALAAELSAGTAGAVASPGQAIFDNLLIRPATQPFRVGTFRLANTTFRLNEGVNRFDLTVERTGDTNSTSAVTFATDPFDGKPCAVSDGKARARCDYQTSIGRLVFAPGETSKNVTFFITDDSYVEGDETFRVALANPSENWGITDPRFATVTIVDNDQGPVANSEQKAQAHAPVVVPQPNPVNTSAFFVRQQYLDFLEREPDAAGFNAWANILNNCAYQGFPGPGKTGSDPSCDRITVSGAFFGSPEFQQKGFFVYRFYKASLADIFNGSLIGRQPTYEEFLTDLNSVSGGQTAADVNARKDAFTDAWLDRPDFRALYEGLSDADFVDRLALTADVTLPNRAQLINDLATHSSDPVAYRQAHARVLRAVVENGVLYNREFNAAFVEMQYFGYLQRDPDQAGYDAWLNYLNSTGDFRTMINGFVYSFEYQSRFGTP